MRDFNKVILAGRAGRDAETKQFRNNGCVTNVSIATTKKWKSDDEWKEHTEWHNLFAFGRIAEEMANIRKGDRVVVTDGELKSEKYKDKNGVERTIVKIQCLSVEFYPPNGNSRSMSPDQRGQNFNQQVKEQYKAANADDDFDLDEDDSDLPF